MDVPFKRSIFHIGRSFCPTKYFSLKNRPYLEISFQQQQIYKGISWKSHANSIGGMTWLFKVVIVVIIMFKLLFLCVPIKKQIKVPGGKYHSKCEMWLLIWEKVCWSFEFSSLILCKIQVLCCHNAEKTKFFKAHVPKPFCVL